MRIVMLLHKSAEFDSRVRREAGALADAGHEVVVVHLPAPGESLAGERGNGWELRSAALGPAGRRLPGPARRALAAARIALVARRAHPDAVHAHDAAMLVPGWLARPKGALLVYDSHELATGVPYRSRFWAALVAAIERLLVPRCDAVITVSGGIADRLASRYGLAARPVVVRNLPDLPPPRPGSPDLRRELGLGEAPLILHQGAVALDRGCEVLIRALALVDGAHLLFLGAQGGFAERLRALARELAVGERTHFRPPVPPRELLSYTAQADVGVTLLEGSCENHRLALPNKAFEYVAAGIPVLASDLPELRAIVDEHGLGWTVDPSHPSAVAGALRTAIGARGDAELRERVRSAADELSWRRERPRLTELYRRLGNPETGAPLGAQPRPSDSA
jgi:glycosyltransferase involved in cell wall biosynthesis